MIARLIVRQNRMRQLGAQFEPAVADVINTGLLNVIMYADASSPVDTGAMRANKTMLFAAPGRLQGSITWNQEYTIYVHDGTQYMEGRPFVADAVDTITPDYLADLANLGLG